MLMKPIPFEDVEIKPDGIIYLPEIKYRRILNQAFGPGGWGMAPRGELAVGERVVTREYALLVHGRYVASPRRLFSFFLLMFCAHFADNLVARTVDLSRKPVVSANSLAMTMASPPPARAARAMH